MSAKKTKKEIAVSWVNQVFTEPDGKTHCPIRWAAFVGTIIGFGLQIYSIVIQNNTFDIQNYGIGFGAILAAAGAAMAIKKDTPRSEGE